MPSPSSAHQHTGDLSANPSHCHALRPCHRRLGAEGCMGIPVLRSRRVRAGPSFRTLYSERRARCAPRARFRLPSMSGTNRTGTSIGRKMADADSCFAATISSFKDLVEQLIFAILQVASQCIAAYISNLNHTR